MGGPTPDAAAASHPQLPRLGQLYRREKEVASVVYRDGLSSAIDVQHALSAPLSNAAVRSMLNRLVRKGVLTQIDPGGGRAFLYGAALNEVSERETELRQFADDYFEGSLDGLAIAIAEIFSAGRAAAN